MVSGFGFWILLEKENGMIKVYCRTNLDNYKPQIWPEEFVCRPEVGDRVEAESGGSLKIHTITHGQRKVYDGGSVQGRQKYESILIIELHN